MTAGPSASVRLGGSAAALPLGSAVLGPADGPESASADVVLQPRDPDRPPVLRYGRVGTGHALLPALPEHGRLSPGLRAEPADGRRRAGPGWPASGLTVGATSANGMIVPVSGTVGHLEQVFSVPLVRARLPGGRVARARSTASPEVPADLAPAVAGVVGLSTVAEAHPQLALDPRAPQPTAASGATEPAVGSTAPSAPTGGQEPHFGPSACPAAIGAASAYGGWTADSLASAYGLSTLYGAGRVGAGQQVGLLELAPYSSSDIAAYQSCFGTSATVSDVTVDGGPIGGAIDEADLDIEMVAGLAPNASVSVFSGPNTERGAIDTYTQMVDDSSIRVLSTSWGVCEPELDAERTGRRADDLRAGRRRRGRPSWPRRATRARATATTRPTVTRRPACSSTTLPTSPT